MGEHWLLSACEAAGNASKAMGRLVVAGTALQGVGRAMTVGLGFGCLIDSDVPVKGLVSAGEAEVGPAIPRVTIRHYPHAKFDESAPLWQHEEEGLLFTPPGAGQFAIHSNRIDQLIRTNDDPEHAAGLLIATALPAMMWMRDGFMLHAATVILPGQAGAIAFIGDSGTGKSTIANRLISDGATLIGDDSLVLRRIGDRVVAWGLAGGQFLPEGEDRQFVELDEPQRANLAQLTDGVPLAAIIRLQMGTGSVEPKRVSALAAIAAILDQQHRPSVPVLLNKRCQIVEFAAFIADQIPVYEWDRDCLTVDQLVVLLARGLPSR